MQIMVLDKNDDIQLLRELGEQWASLSHGADYGLPMDVNIGLSTLQTLKNSSSGDVLALLDGDRIVGFMGLAYRPNHIGPGLIANESLFFVSPSARGGGRLLKNSAEKLARARGCGFIIFTASRIAGDADRAGRFFQHGGCQPFETAYLKVL